MAEGIGREANPVMTMERLMALDQTMIQTYDKAVERMTSTQYRDKLQSFRDDYERQVSELEPLVRQFGGEPPQAPDGAGMLTGSDRSISDLADDEAILLALKTNEDDASSAYRQAMSVVPEEARDIIARGLDCERRHSEWCSSVLSGMSASGSYQGLDDTQE